MSINHVVLTGNLTRDAELKVSPSGVSVLEVGIAVNDRIKRGDEWVDRPNFFDVIVFGKRAESLTPLLTRGLKVTVEGKLRWSSWETQDGQKRSRVQVIAENVEFMGRPAGAAANDQPASAPDYTPPAKSGTWEGNSDDDIPF